VEITRRRTIKNLLAIIKIFVARNNGCHAAKNKKRNEEKDEVVAKKYSRF
jgi:hypothetical protein